MAERKSDRWISLTQSVLLHAAVIGALAYGFYAYKKQAKPPPPPTLAIEGTVVDPKDLQPVQPKSAPLPKPPDPVPEPPPPPPEDTGPPSPTPEEIQQREQEEQQQKEQERKAAEERVAIEKKQAEEKETAERRVREEAEKKRQQEQREAEEKRVADAKRKAEEKRKADEARVREAQEAELRKSVEAEDRLNQLRNSGAMISWVQQIANRIQRAWLRPSSARPGIDCVVHVTQVPGGAVTSVKVGECNGDAAVRQSIEDAVLRASPLPPPPDPALFERDLDIHFRPTD
jgi:colicin import membrane protein